MPPTATLAELRADALDGKDVVVAGHVTYVAPEQGLAFIQDATHGVPIELGPDGLRRQAGRSRGAGRTRPGPPCASPPDASARAEYPAVVAARSRLRAIPSRSPAGRLNATRIKLAARVQAATRVGTGLSLTLTSRGYELARLRPGRRRAGRRTT